MIELPLGTYFLPEDENMMIMLGRKVSGQPLHHCDVRGMHLPRDVDVSQFEPEELPRTHRGDRRIGGRHRGRAVGFKRMFIYYQGKAPNEVKTVWMMKEVRLNPRCQQHQNLDPKKMQSCVMCKVYNYLDEYSDSEDHVAYYEEDQD